MTHRSISLDDLPLWSPWPGRLLGITPWSSPRRNHDKVTEEYDDGKYRRCLEWYTAQASPPSAVALQDNEMGMAPADELCISIGDDLVVVELREFRERFAQMLVDALMPYVDGVDTIVELGCGYGFNLAVLRERIDGVRFVGGDYSERAVELGGLLFADDDRVAVHRFDFYADRYEPLERAEGRLLVFTNHAVEQLPTAVPLLKVLDTHRERIQGVVHCEPVGHPPTTLLQMLRFGYAEANDYNRDLRTLVGDRSDVTVDDVEPNVLGVNPVNPTTVIRWRYG